MQFAKKPLSAISLLKLFSFCGILQMDKFRFDRNRGETHEKTDTAVDTSMDFSDTDSL